MDLHVPDDGAPHPPIPQAPQLVAYHREPDEGNPQTPTPTQPPQLDALMDATTTTPPSPPDTAPQRDLSVDKHLSIEQMNKSFGVGLHTLVGDKLTQIKQMFYDEHRRLRKKMRRNDPTNILDTFASKEHRRLRKKMRRNDPTNILDTFASKGEPEEKWSVQSVSRELPDLPKLILHQLQSKNTISNEDVEPAKAHILRPEKARLTMDIVRDKVCSDNIECRISIVIQLNCTRLRLPDQDVPATCEYYPLRGLRMEFIMRVSEECINSLLDGLLEKQVINCLEMEEIRAEKSRSEKARRIIIDMVWNKGPRACEEIMAIIQQVDPDFHELLGLCAPIYSSYLPNPPCQRMRPPRQSKTSPPQAMLSYLSQSHPPPVLPPPGSRSRNPSPRDYNDEEPSTSQADREYGHQYNPSVYHKRGKERSFGTRKPHYQDWHRPSTSRRFSPMNQGRMDPTPPDAPSHHRRYARHARAAVLKLWLASQSGVAGGCRWGRALATKKRFIFYQKKKYFRKSSQKKSLIIWGRGIKKFENPCARGSSGRNYGRKGNFRE